MASSPPATSASGSGAAHAGSTSPEIPATTAATTASGTPADAATTHAVTAAYEAFFSYQSTAQQSEDALQAGSQFAAVLAQQGQQSYAQKSSATVASVSMIAPDTAKVSFSVLVGGQPLLPGATGFAVRIGGSWKVAAVTFCGLLKLQGDKVDACNDPSVTALPQ